MNKLLVLLTSVFLISIVSSSMAFATAGTVQKNMTYVYGTVYDGDGNGIWKAKVLAHCIETDAAKFDPNTDKNGNYEITTLECSVGNRVNITVIKGDVEIGIGTGIVQECTDELPMCKSGIHEGIVKIDVEGSGDIPIPEFPIAALPALLSMFSFGLIRKKLF